MWWWFWSKEKKLVQAAERGDLDAVRALLAQGAKPNATHGGFSAIVMAVGGGHEAVLRALLDAGADPNTHGESETDALSASVMGRAEGATALLLERGARSHRARDDEGFSTLHLAAGRGTVAQLSLLLPGSSVDSATEDGRTPLFEACYWGAFANANLLLDRGASPAAKGRNGLTPLGALVSSMRMWRMMAAIPEDARGLSGLAAVAQGVSAATTDASSAPPEMLALIDRLVGAGADVSARDDQGATVLEVARREGAAPVVLEKLRSVGAR